MTTSQGELPPVANWESREDLVLIERARREGKVKVRFRGLGSGRRQVLSLCDDGSIEGRVVSRQGKSGLRRSRLVISAAQVRHLNLTSGRSRTAGIFLLLAIVVWTAIGWNAIAGSATQSDATRAILFIAWLLNSFVVIELWGATTPSWLEIGSGWEEPIVISVAPWSRRTVQAWIDDVREELGLAVEDVEVDHGLDEEIDRFNDPTTRPE